MTLGEYIDKELRKLGFRDLKEASKAKGLPTNDYETLRRTVNDKHMPNMKFLKKLSDKYGLDANFLFLLAFQGRIAKELDIDTKEAIKYTQLKRVRRKLLNSINNPKLKDLIEMAAGAEPDQLDTLIKVANAILS